MAAFRKQTFEQSVVSLAARLRQNFPKQTEALTKEGRLERWVRSGIQRAQGFGLRQRDTIARFLEYLMIYGESFAETSETEWARSILEQSGINEALKMDMIDSYEFFVARGANGSGRR